MASAIRHALWITFAVGACAPQRDQLAEAPARWRLVETVRGAYTLQVDGSADRVESQVTVGADSAPPNAYGQAELGVPTRPGTLRRVHVSAKIQTEQVRARAALWVRGDRNGARLLTEYAAIPARGTSGWQTQETGLILPESATAVVVGVLLQGSGHTTIRELKVHIEAVPPASTPLEPRAAQELDSAIHLAKTHALWRDTITWQAVEARVRHAAAGARTPEAVHSAIRLLASALGDAHSSLYTPADVKAFRSSANVPVIDVHAIAGDIGYVYVSGYLAENIAAGNKYVRDTHNAIDRIRSSARCGWVLDLRGNVGGVAEPMLASLSPFIPSESLQEDEQTALRAWFGRTPVPEPLGLNNTYVAVLIGPQTGSAGERTLLVLQRRPHSRTFGSPTAGVATRRPMFWLPDSAMFAVTTGAIQSGQSRRKVAAIIPNELVSSDAPGDAVLEAATNWLSRNACKSGSNSR